jgi:hypothetical protein
MSSAEKGGDSSAFDVVREQELLRLRFFPGPTVRGATGIYTTHMKPLFQENPSFQDIKQLAETTYSDEWRRIFPQDRGLKPADLFISDEVGGGRFWFDRNQIDLSIGEQFADYDLDVKGWPTWVCYLAHEMIHEYEFKVLNRGSTNQGVQLHQQVCAARRNFWPEYEHEAPFFTAVIAVAPFYGLSGCDLFEKL